MVSDGLVLGGVLLGLFSGRQAFCCQTHANTRYSAKAIMELDKRT